MISKIFFSALTSLTMLVALCAASFAREIRLSEVIQLAKEHAPALAAAEASVRASQSARRSIESERLGTLSLTSTAVYQSEISSLNLSIPGLPPISRELGTHENFQNEVRYSLPLWTGGRLGSSIALAAVSESIAEALAQSDTLRILYQSHLEYFNLAAMTESARLAEVALARVQNLQKEVNDLYAAGMSDSLGIIEAELAVNRARLQLTQASNAKRRAEIRLMQFCGLPVSEEITTGDSLYYAVVTYERDSNPMRPELRIAQLKVDLADKGMNLTRSDYLPNIGAFAGYSFGKPNLDRFGNSWNDYWSLGAQLSWSLNLGGKTAESFAQKSFQRHAALYEYKSLEEQFDTDELLSGEKSFLAAQTYFTQRERTALRSTAFRLSQNQFREGVLSASRLFDSEQLLSEAELSEALALVEWFTARSTLWYVSGSPLLSNGELY